MSSRQATSRDNKNLVSAILVDQQAKEDKLNQLSTVEYSKIKFVHLTQQIIDKVNISSASPYTSADIRAISGIGPTVQAFLGTLWASTNPQVNLSLYIGSSDDTLDDYGQSYRWYATGAGDILHTSQLVLVKLGTDGKFKIQSSSVTAIKMSLSLIAVLE